MSTKSVEDLLMAYLSVCNRAIALNKDRFPFKQILGAARETGKNRLIEVRILNDSLQEGESQSYVMTFEKDKIIAKPHESCVNCNCDGIWRVSIAYLVDVTKNAESYIENPAKINWEWLCGNP